MYVNLTQEISLGVVRNTYVMLASKLYLDNVSSNSCCYGNGYQDLLCYATGLCNYYRLVVTFRGSL